MFKTSLLRLSLLAGNAAAAPANETAHEEALDLELEIEGRRELFPLLPGTKCPSGHRCRASPRAHWPARHQANGVAPLMSSLRDNINRLEQPARSPILYLSSTTSFLEAPTELERGNGSYKIRCNIRKHMEL